jgi:hypothetical protein
MDDKQEILSDTERAYAELREAIDGIPAPRMTDPWLGTWGAREIAIHISGWHREMVPALERIARGQSPYPDGVSYDDYDAWNAKFVEDKRGVKVADVLAELSASHRAFMAAASALPAAHLAPGGGARDLVSGVGAQHYREHAGQIRGWRAEQRL